MNVLDRLTAALAGRYRIERELGQGGTIPERSWNIGIPVWHTDGRILVASAGGLYAIPSTGGTATKILGTDSSSAEGFVGVGTLRDGRLLLSVASARDTFTDVLSADGSKRTRILPGLTSVRVVNDTAVASQSASVETAWS